MQQISQKTQEIKTLQSSLQKKRKEENAVEEQLQNSIKESETMQNKLKQEVDHMSAQVYHVLYKNFEEEAALRQVLVIHPTMKISQHINTQLSFLFSICRKSRGWMQLLND